MPENEKSGAATGANGGNKKLRKEPLLSPRKMYDREDYMNVGRDQVKTEEPKSSHTYNPRDDRGLHAITGR